jgi:hypothetical protein
MPGRLEIPKFNTKGTSDPLLSIGLPWNILLGRVSHRASSRPSWHFSTYANVSVSCPQTFFATATATTFQSSASSTFLRVHIQSANLSVFIHPLYKLKALYKHRSAVNMEEERSPTKSDYDSSYPVRPSMSRSSSVSSFLGRQGFDRYGDEWGGGALTLIGELLSFESSEQADI